MPFGDRDDAKSFMRARIGQAAPELRTIDPAIPAPLSDAIATLLAIRPEDRPATAREASHRPAVAVRDPGRRAD